MTVFTSFVCISCLQLHLYIQMYLHRNTVVPKAGFEPAITGSKPGVLPLDDLGMLRGCVLTASFRLSQLAEPLVCRNFSVLPCYSAYLLPVHVLRLVPILGGISVGRIFVIFSVSFSRSCLRVKRVTPTRNTNRNRRFSAPGLWAEGGVIRFDRK